MMARYTACANASVVQCAHQAISCAPSSFTSSASFGALFFCFGCFTGKAVPQGACV